MRNENETNTSQCNFISVQKSAEDIETVRNDVVTMLRLSRPRGIAKWNENRGDSQCNYINVQMSSGRAGRVIHGECAWDAEGQARAVISELCLPRRKPPIGPLTFSSGGHAYGHDSHGQPGIRSGQRKHEFGVSSDENKLAIDAAARASQRNTNEDNFLVLHKH